MNVKQYIDPVLSNPLYTAILLLLGILLLWTILKKLVKAVIFLLAVTIACAVFFWYTGKEVPASGHDLLQIGSEQVGTLKDTGMSLLREWAGADDRPDATQSPRQSKP